MNREIKFRAYDKKGRFDIADVLFIDFHEKYVVVDAEWNRDIETGESDCVANFDEIELMQYTGLKDKNGKEIYEGDILKNGTVVTWGVIDGGYEGQYGFGFKVNPFHSEGDEVIGNVYENPELLKGKL